MSTIRTNGFIVGIIIACFIVIAPIVALAAWSEPSQAPTGGNVDPPINTGSGNQVKNGGLSVNTLAVFGSTAINGNTYLKTGVTGSIYRYLNFGVGYDVNGTVISSTTGESGYGIRDKDGTLEFKNLGGSWQSIQAILWELCGGPCGSGSSSWTESGNDIYNTNTGRVGIGVTNPRARLEVADQILINDTGPVPLNFGGHGECCGGGDTGIGHPGDGILTMMSNSQERVRLDPQGRVGIGTNNPISKLYVVGNAGEWSGYFTGGTHGVYVNGGSAEAYLGYSGYALYTGYPLYSAGGYQGSDRRMKDNIVTVSDSLPKLGKIKGVSFVWNQGVKKGQRDVGVIAQDVQNVVPEAVSTDPNGMLAVDYSRLVPLLINAVNEQRKAIEDQQIKIEILQNQLAELKAYTAF